MTEGMESDRHFVKWSLTMYGARGDWMVAALIRLLTVMPPISLVHSAAMVGGMWFALRPGQFLSRGIAAAMWLIFTSAVVYFLNDYAIAISSVAFVMVWLLTRVYEVQLVTLREMEKPRRDCSALHKGLFSLGFLLWLAVTVSYLFAAKQLCDPRSMTGPIATAILESIVLTAVFIGITCVCLKVNLPAPWIVIVIQFISPLMITVVGLLMLPQSESLDAVVWSDLGGMLDRVLIATVFGVPLLTVILLAGRQRGYRLVRNN
jgi:hypothetical protein